MAADGCSRADEVHIRRFCRRHALIIVADYNFCPTNVGETPLCLQIRVR
jgi:hypothetical protein